MPTNALMRCVRTSSSPSEDDLRSFNVAPFGHSNHHMRVRFQHACALLARVSQHTLTLRAMRGIFKLSSAYRKTTRW